MKNFRIEQVLIALTVCIILTSCSLGPGSRGEYNQGNNGDPLNEDPSMGSNTVAYLEEGYDYIEGEKVQFPLKESISLSLYVHSRPNVDDYKNNAFTKYIEERTNINLEFVVGNSNLEGQELSLMLATGDYPDLILGSQLNPTMQSLYGEQGILIPLNELIRDFGSESQRVFEQYPDVYNTIVMSNDQIYNLPKISECYHCVSTQKMWIYKPWLEKLGLELPTTTEEFRNVLTAFKTMDPNGNGRADEIPFAGAIKGWNSQIEAQIMNSFVYTAYASMNGARKLYVEDDVVKASYVQEGWREGLKYLQQLTDEGLIAKESFTQLDNGLRSMGENPDEVILGVFSGGSPVTGTSLNGNRWKDYIGLSPLEGPEGIRYANYDPYRTVAPGFSITNKCAYPEIAFALADLMYEEVVSLSNALGPQDIAWQYIDDVTKKGIDGETATWEVLDTYNTREDNISWQQVGNSYRSSQLRLGRYEDSSSNIEEVLYKTTKESYEPYFPQGISSMPNLVFTEEQSAQLLNLSNVINNFVDEKTAEYSVTHKDIDKEWASYVADLNDMGLEKMIAIYQEAYDAYNMQN